MTDRTVSKQPCVQSSPNGYRNRMWWKPALAVVLLLVAGCSRSDPIDAAIQNHADEPGVVDFLEVGKQAGVYKQPGDVDKVATFFTSACTFMKMGTPQAGWPRTALRSPPWSLDVSEGQASALAEATPNLCSGR